MRTMGEDNGCGYCAAAGVRAEAARVGGIIAPTIPPVFAAFLHAARAVAVGRADDDGRVWATFLVGAPGVVDASPTQLRVGMTPAPGDALHARLTTRDATDEPAAVGLTVIDLATRRRVRVNGRLATADVGRFTVAVEEAYGNCPKYIQTRTAPRGAPASAAAGDAAVADVEVADVAEAEALSDAHRAWLAVPDFTTGRLLQLSGTAAIDWRSATAGEFSGAERVVAARPLTVQPTTKRPHPVVSAPVIPRPPEPPSDPVSAARKVRAAADA